MRTILTGPCNHFFWVRVCPAVVRGRCRTGRLTGTFGFTEPSVYQGGDGTRWCTPSRRGATAW